MFFRAIAIFGTSTRVRGYADLGRVLIIDSVEFPELRHDRESGTDCRKNKNGA